MTHFYICVISKVFFAIFDDFSHFFSQLYKN